MVDTPAMSPADPQPVAAGRSLWRNADFLRLWAGEGISLAGSQVTELASIFEAKILDVGFEAVTLMVAGQPDKLDAMTDLLKPFGIVEMQRTGRIALPKLSRQSSKLRVVRNKTA